MAHSSDWDTLDPGETYYGFSWNFSRLYGRSLLMFKPAPGDDHQGDAGDDGTGRIVDDRRLEPLLLATAVEVATPGDKGGPNRKGATERTQEQPCG